MKSCVPALLATITLVTANSAAPSWSIANGRADACSKLYRCLTVAIAFASDPLPRIRRSTSCQDGTYTAPIGLAFNVMCDTNWVLSDLDNPPGNRTAVDIYDCARQCSLARAQCYGAAYNIQSGACWLKNISIYETVYFGKLQDPNTHFSLVTPSSQIATAYDTDCPFEDASTQTTNDGMSYKVHCNRDIAGYNDDHISPDFFPWHAISLTDCMNQCSGAHPLCSGVSFFPQMAQGYANCYPKTRLPSPVPNAAFVLTTGAVVHSGVGNLTYGNNSDCKDNYQFTTADGTKYVTMCNQDRDVTSIDKYHVSSLVDCMKGCASYSGPGGTCIGAVYDSTMTYGYNNCYLKNVTGTPVTSNATQGFVFARLSTVNDTASAPSSGGGLASSGWIAGPVIGGLVILVAAVAIAVVVRRRKTTALGKYSSVPVGQYQHAGKYAGQSNQYSEMSSSAPVTELPLSPAAAELGGGRVAEEKYELAASHTYR